MPRDIPEPYTADMFDAVITALQDECARLLAVKAKMEIQKVDQIPVKNSISLKKRGLPIVIAFTQAAVDAIREQRLGG